MHQNIHYTVNTPLLILKCLRFDTVELTILSNHGHPEYTCLYRFRLVTFLTHGSVEIVPYPLYVPARPLVTDKIVLYPLFVPARPLVTGKNVPYPLLASLGLMTNESVPKKNLLIIWSPAR